MHCSKLALIAVLCGGCMVHISTDSDSVEFDEPVTGIVTDLGAGDVVITGANTVGAVVYRDLEWSGQRRPEVSAVVEGGVLYLTADCSAQVVCKVNHDVIVSEAIWSDIMTGSGDVTMRGVDEGALIETGSGNITLSGVHGDISAGTGSGEVSIEDSIGDLDLSTGSGDVVVSNAIAALLIASTGSGDVVAEVNTGLNVAEISAGSGDVELTVPSGSYAMNISTGSGDVELSGVSDDSDGDRRLSISTGSGDVRVRGQ